MQDVHYYATWLVVARLSITSRVRYFIVSKYNPSKLYGRSPVNTMWRQAMTLTAMDNYMYTSYQKRRVTQGNHLCHH